MKIKYNIAGYCRISVDEELDRDNTSIENQKAIISDFVRRKFPDSTLDFYEDRDKSGYTFEQRDGYQALRKRLVKLDYDILVVKDFSRFSRRNSKGLVELEDLRDAGVRIISIGDSIDYPTYDDWTAIQFRFLINEMPVTDTSKKVKSVIKRRQDDGKWICAVPYGYLITNSKNMDFVMDEPSAEVVREIFRLYNEGWGYKKIANHLTEQHIPTPRMSEKLRREAKGEEYRCLVRENWSIVTVSEIITNDFYIGTLRQRKYTRKKINGADKKLDESEHIVFENNHEPIVDYRTFAEAQQQLALRTNSNYRGVKKHENNYTGFLFCGDCGSPMFSMSRSDLADAYRCGTYHRQGVKYCSSHHIRCDTLDGLLKEYLKKVRDNCGDMIEKLQKSIDEQAEKLKHPEMVANELESQIADAHNELKVLMQQKTRDMIRNPEQANVIGETYDELLDETSNRITGLENQLCLTSDRRNKIIETNRKAKTVIEIFDTIINKEKLSKSDIGFIVDRINIFEDHIEINLKSDIDALLKTGEAEQSANFQHDIINSLKLTAIQTAKNRLDKVYDVNVISDGDPLEIFTDKEGGVIFKKYSPLGELNNFANDCCCALYSVSGMNCAVCDKDNVVACAGQGKRDILERALSDECEKLIEERKNYFSQVSDKGVKIISDTGSPVIIAASPIISEGDVTGLVAFLETPGKKPSVTEEKLISSYAMFLGKQMEN